VKVAIIGQGYVGLPLALAVAESGADVIGIDLNEDRVKILNSGHSNLEDVSDKKLQKYIKKNRYRASNDFAEISDCQVILICVPTPLDNFGNPDLGMVLSAADSISKNLPDGALIILESSVAPGNTRGELKATLKRYGKKFDLAYSPERIDPAGHKSDLARTPKLVAGIDEKSLTRAKAFYSKFVKNVVVCSSLEVVETAKLVENSFRLVNISFINEVAKYCEQVGINVSEVIYAASTKPYGFMPFYPSVGVGGHCIPIDPVYLLDAAKKVGVQITSIETANHINHSMPMYYLNLVKEKLEDLKDKKILIVGLGYKPNIADLRESSAIKLLELLRSEGALVSWSDDLVGHWNGEISTSISNDFDLIILANPGKFIDLSGIDKQKILNTQVGKR
jgi:UDP-N-acetyl-D-glucosamine dehydrogenase